MVGLRISDILHLLTPAHPQLASALRAAPAAAQQALASAARRRSLSRGETVLPAGLEVSELGYVLEGTLGMVRILPDGREHIIGILVPHDMYGRLYDGPNGYALTALTDAQTLVFDRAALESVLAGTPELERMFVVSVLDELDAAREWILLLNGTTVVERVASFLLILARRDGLRRGDQAGAGLSVRLPIARADFARCLGIRPESLSRALHKLARQKIIGLGQADRIEIRDIAALTAAAGQDLLLPQHEKTFRAG